MLTGADRNIGEQEKEQDIKNERAIKAIQLKKDDEMMK